MSTRPVVSPLFSENNRRRVARYRHTFERDGIDALAASVAKMSAPRVRASLILAIASENWDPDEKAALNPDNPKGKP